MKNIIILGFLFTFLFSDSVNLERAMTVAENFSNARTNSFNLDSVETIEENSRVYFYVFRFENRGFVIVSANDSAMPILAYSFDNIFGNNLEDSTNKLHLIPNVGTYDGRNYGGIYCPWIV